MTRLPRAWYSAFSPEVIQRFRTPAIFELQSYARIAITWAQVASRRRRLGQGIKNGMEHRSKAAPENGLTRQNREDLERIVIRLLEISARSGDPAIQFELMQLADELAKVMER